MMSLHKSVNKLPIRQIIVIGLITIITWLIAVFGWKQALNIINDDGFFHEEVNMPSFLSTLFVLPLPCGAYFLFGYLLRKHTTVPWKTLLDGFIICMLILTILAQGLFVGLLIFIGLAGGGLDIMLPWETGIIFEAVLYPLPLTMPITLITVLIFVGLRKQNYAYWSLLPAIVANGMTVFRLIFLFSGIQA